MKRVLPSLVLLAGLVRLAAAAEHFDFEGLRYRARQLAARPYTRSAEVPAVLTRLSYDDYRNIAFNPRQTLWRREHLPFELQFYHPGFIYNHPVHISLVEGGETAPVAFSRKYFEYRNGLELPELPDDTGFAGLRILGSLNQPQDELISFLGGSYFRALCLRSVYGLSARGLAINTADPAGEEFPSFEEFWVEQPAADAHQFVIYALLNGPTAAGAYRFTVTPGTDTVTQVRLALFCRQNPHVLGIAPLTSMYWHGENSAGRGDDFRPEVHDSDGLLLATGAGEWLWRPLVNPAVVREATFSDENPRGFGLLQRDRKFDSYEDLEANYQSRPSAWVEPVGNWGRGAVRLVEIPSPDETNDNIVAFWTPAQLPNPGEAIEIEYRLHWNLDQIRPPAGLVVATRIGVSRTHEPDLRRFIVDFDGMYLHQHNADPAIELVVSAGKGGTVLYPTVMKNPHNGTWRAAFALRPDGSGQPVELRCFLRKAPHVLTETWSYLWNP